jgi:hypothetical protein
MKHEDSQAKALGRRNYASIHTKVRIQCLVDDAKRWKATSQKPERSTWIHKGPICMEV